MQRRVLRMHARHPEVIDRFVRFIYTMTYADGDFGNSVECAKLEAEMCGFAHAYEISCLKALVTEKFKSCTAHWSSEFLSNRNEDAAEHIAFARTSIPQQVPISSPSSSTRSSTPTSWRCRMQRLEGSCK